MTISFFKYDQKASFGKDKTDVIDNHDGELGYKMIVENIDANGMVNFHIKQMHDVPDIFAK